MIGIDDPRWCELFPHIVRPRVEDDECLLGLVLRCDDANGWPSGTTVYYCRREIAKNGGRLDMAGAYIVATCIGLKRLARGLGVDVADVEKTTFLPELRRLYPDRRPDTALLMPTPPFRVCPRCIWEDKLLTRSLLLPYIGLCPQHDGEAFVYTCRCGAPLEPFRRLSVPFACPRCGCAWAALTGGAAGADRRAANRRVVDMYRTMLSTYDAARLANAMTHIRYALKTHCIARTINPDAADGRLLPTFRLESCYAGRGGVRILPIVVASASALALTVDDLQEPTDQYGTPTTVCLNRACPLFGKRGMENIRRAHSEHPEDRYCKECGSCFTGNRIQLSFDSTGGTDEGMDTIGAAEAQKRLMIWKDAAVAVCESMIAADETITAATVWKRAGIPRARHLRATRLGLVGVIRTYVDRQDELRSMTAPRTWCDDRGCVRQVEDVPGSSKPTIAERQKGSVVPSENLSECPPCHETVRQTKEGRSPGGNQRYGRGRRGYPPETRAEAVRRYRASGSKTRVARQLGISPTAVARWVAAHTNALPNRPSQPDGRVTTAESDSPHADVGHEQGEHG